MTSVIQNMARVFIYKKQGKEIELEDIDPNQSPKDILSFYSGMYPELTVSGIKGPEIKNDKAYYYFSESVGVKG